MTIRQRSAYRFARWIVGASLLVFPFTAWTSFHAKTNTQDLNNWIDTRSPQYAFYQEFRERFASDDVIMVSWPGCTTTDSRLVQLTRRLREADRQELCASITSGIEMLEILRKPPARFSNLSARKRLRGSLISEDLQSTCLIIRLSDKGSTNRQLGLELVRDAIREMPELDASEIRLAGKAVASVALEESTNRALLLGIPGSILAALVAWILIGSWRQTMAALYASGLSALVGITLVRINGTALNGLLVLMPVMVFVLTLGGAFHLTRALQREIPGTVSIAEAIRRAAADLSRPVTLSMLTTAIGIASLGISRITAVRQFGLYSAIAILIATLILLFVLPACWAVLYPAGKKIDTRKPEPASDKLGHRLLHMATSRPAVTLLLSGLICIPAIVGISRLKTDLNVHHLFDPDSRVAVDHRWFEQHLFPLGKVELLVRFPAAQQVGRYSQLLVIRGLQGRLRQHPACQSAMSVANLVTIPPSARGLQRHFVQQSVGANIELQASRFQQAGLLYSDSEANWWRISLSCPISEDLDESTAARQFHEIAEQALEGNETGASCLITGIGPLSAAGQRQLFTDLLRSLALAFVIVTPVVVVVLKDVRLGLLAMIPNVFPVLIVFGYFGLAGRHLNIGSLLTASVGLGIAVDDTIHFLHQYLTARPESAAGDPMNQRRQAVQRAFRNCKSAMTATTAVVCCGMLFFLFSGFLPVRQFAVCLILIMLAAIVADLVMLPALLLARTPWNKSSQDQPGTSPSAGGPLLS